MDPLRIHLDYETRSRVDLKKCGLRNYVPQAEIILAAWATPEGPVQQWDALLGEGDREELLHYLEDPEVEIHAFNSPFEREITSRCLGVYPPLSRWHCTMSFAYSRAFTGTLHNVCEQIGVPQTLAKLRGSHLIRRFCCPRKPTKKNPREWWVPEDNPEAWEEFKQYNRHDVLAERYIFDYLNAQHPETPEERETWLWDARVNNRGLPLDLDLIEGALAVRKDLVDRALLALQQITGLDNPNSRNQLLPWLQERGYPEDNLQKATVQKILDDEKIPF